MGTELIDSGVCNDIYDLLVKYAGATEYWRDNFVFHLSRVGCREFRIQGHLGFGGKFRNCNGRWYIDCYPEDENNDRRLIMAVVNEKLAEMKDAATAIDKTDECTENTDVTVYGDDG